MADDASDRERLLQPDHERGRFPRPFSIWRLTTPLITVAIGAVNGHEIGHGFDDQGRRSDGDGSLTDWWTEATTREFSPRSKKLVEQYNAYNPIDNLHVNGAFTPGENIGDLGGLTIA